MGSYDSGGPSDEEGYSTDGGGGIVASSYNNNNNNNNFNNNDDTSPPPQTSNSSNKVRSLERGRRHRSTSAAPPPPPPPPTLPAAIRATRVLDQLAGVRTQQYQEYPTTIKVKNSGGQHQQQQQQQQQQQRSRSRITERAYADRARRKAARHTSSHDVTLTASTNEYDTDEEGDEEAYFNRNIGLVHYTNDNRSNNYESFGITDNSIDHSFAQTTDSEDVQQQECRRKNHILPPLIQQQHHQPPPPTKTRPQVLVHYHPQLGDTGYESTLLEQTNEQSKPPEPINLSGGNGSYNNDHRIRPPKQITTNWMHVRAIDDVRAVDSSPPPPPIISTSSGGGGGGSGNDEHNNAATRQIRRRVLRAAIERSAMDWGLPDERRRKMYEADADIGGPGLGTASGVGGVGWAGGGAARGTTNAVFVSGRPRSTRNNPRLDAFLRSPASVSVGSNAEFDAIANRAMTPGTTVPNNIHGPIFTPGSQITVPSPGTGNSNVPRPPSYRTLVHDLIASNEPEKLAQLDRVMEKYVGREEELIKKLDLRYRRRKMKNEVRQLQSAPPPPVVLGNLNEALSVDRSNNVDNRRTERGLSSPPPPPPPPQALEADDDGDRAPPLPVIQTRVLSPPKRLTFIKVEKKNMTRGGINSINSWDKSEDTAERKRLDAQITDKMAPTKITAGQGLLSNEILSDSTKVNGGGGWSEEDDAEGMIPNTRRLNIDSITNLSNQAENQVEIERRMKLEESHRSEQDMDAEVEETANAEDSEEGGQEGDDQDELLMPPDIARKLPKTVVNSSTQQSCAAMTGEDDEDPGTIPNNCLNVNATTSEDDVQIEQLTLEERRQRLVEKRMRLEKMMMICSPQSALSSGSAAQMGLLSPDYDLLKTASHISNNDDGISVITMETKSTMPFKMTPSVGGGDGMYSFDEILKRPPNSITVESSGHGGDDIADMALLTTRMQIKSEYEKAKLVESSSETSAKLDSVEARIRARNRMMMEEEISKKRENTSKVRGLDLSTLIESQDELSDIVNVSSEENYDTNEGTKEKSADLNTTMDSDDVEANEEDVITGHPIHAGTQTLNEEETCGLPVNTLYTMVASPNDKSFVSALSHHSSMSAIADATRAELKRLREFAQFHQERDATNNNDPVVEEEITRLISEKESRIQAEQAVALMNAQRELEAERKARLEAETAKVKAEIELERLKLDKKLVKEKDMLTDHEQEPVEDEASATLLESQELATVVGSVLTPTIIGRDEPESVVERSGDSLVEDISASRLEAEKELELLRAKRVAAQATEDDEIAPELDINELMSANSDVDAVRKFQHVYSFDDDKVPQSLIEEDDNRNKLDNVLESSICTKLSDEIDIYVAMRSETEQIELHHEIIADDGNISAQNEQTDLEKYFAQKKLSVDKAGVKNKSVSNLADENVEAEIHHVAVVTFEGNYLKGQLSFTTGTKVEAHSNQRGPWWLGRCGGRTGWFPARAVVRQSVYLARINGPSVDYNVSEEVPQLSEDDLHAVYDLIRNPSDPVEDNDDDDENDIHDSPARSRWLDTGAGEMNTDTPSARDHSPPPTRLDPSEQAGLSERLYESNDGDSPSNTNDVPAETHQNNVTTDSAVLQSPNAESPARRKPKGDWRAAKDSNSGLMYYYHIKTKEVSLDIIHTIYSILCPH